MYCPQLGPVNSVPYKPSEVAASNAPPPTLSKNKAFTVCGIAVIPVFHAPNESAPDAGQFVR